MNAGVRGRRWLAATAEAVLASFLAVGLFASGSFFPVLGIALSLLCPLPFVAVGLRHGRATLLLALAIAPRSRAQAGRKATVAVLIPFPESEKLAQTQRAVLASSLEKLGWREGQNLRLEVRFAAGDAQQQSRAAELMALQPGVMVVQSNPAVAIARKQSGAVPIVFVAGSDPVGRDRKSTRLNSSH